MHVLRIAQASAAFYIYMPWKRENKTLALYCMYIIDMMG